LTLSDLASAANAIMSSVRFHAHVDVGYVAAMAGIILLAIFAAAGLAIVSVRLARRIWNATPKGLLTALFVAAWVLLIIGLVTP